MATYSQVYKIREITDNDEVIMDISFCLVDDDGRIRHCDAGYGMIFLKDGTCMTQIAAPWMPEDELKKSYERILEDMKGLCIHIREKEAMNKLFKVAFNKLVTSEYGMLIDVTGRSSVHSGG